MLVGIHKDRYGQVSNNLLKYNTILQHNNIDTIFLDVSDDAFWDKVRNVDYFIYRWIHYDDYHQIAKSILPII